MNSDNGNSISGLDMKPTIEWYRANVTELSRMLRLGSRRGATSPMTVSFQAEGGTSPIGHKAMLTLIGRFPTAAVARSNLKRVVVKPPAWFHSDSVGGTPRLTENASEALSPTAIIPSMVTYEEDDSQPCGFSGTIVLFDLTPHGLSDEVQQIIHTQGFVHEFGHTIVTPQLHGEDKLPKLRFPGGNEMSGAKYLLGFQNAVASCPPISHYASAYMQGGKLREMANSPLTPLNEVIAETMAAINLRFAFRLDGTGLEPFRDRNQLADYITQFLVAENVSA